MASNEKDPKAPSAATPDGAPKGTSATQPVNPGAAVGPEIIKGVGGLTSSSPATQGGTFIVPSNVKDPKAPAATPDGTSKGTSTTQPVNPGAAVGSEILEGSGGPFSSSLATGGGTFAVPSNFIASSSRKSPAGSVPTGKDKGVSAGEPSAANPAADPAKDTGPKGPSTAAGAGTDKVAAAQADLDQKLRHLARAKEDALSASEKKRRAPTKPGVVLGGNVTSGPSIEEANRILVDAGVAARAAEVALHETRVAQIPLTPEEEFGRLDLGVPLVLLPVRIETRFSRDANRLLVRIYPDEIFADGHEPELTAAELQAGRSYWAAVAAAPAATDSEADAWRALTQQYAAPRAAWIVRTTQPAGVGPDGRLTGDETLPAGIPTRARSWSRPVLARALPDRWILLLTVGTARRPPIVGRPILLSLALSLDPRRPAEGPGAPPPVDAWLTDFAVACEAGMGFSIETDSAMRTNGINRLMVLGVRSTLDPERSAVELENLFQAHHYHSGLAFVPQGTPTTNTLNYRTGYPAKDPGGQETFRVERRPARGAGDDGKRVATALGLREDLFDHVAGGDREEREAARAMMTVLWPATLGYWLEVLMDPLVPAATQAALREWAIANVQGRGPLPAFRVGRVPYGILPVTTVGAWKSASDDPKVESDLLRALQALLPSWREVQRSVRSLSHPAGPDGPDPNNSVFRVLNLLPSSDEIRRRVALGGQFVAQALEAQGIRQTAYWRDHLRLTREPLRRLGEGLPDPRLAAFMQANISERIDLPLVGDGPDGQVEYLEMLRTAAVDKLQSDELLHPEALRPWLYRLVRHAMLLELRRVARAMIETADPSISLGPIEPEVINVPGFADPSVEVFRAPAPTGSAEPSMQQRLLLSRLREGHPELGKFDEQLERLGKLRRSELERLLSETLDVSSHRIDAWVTALATRRLDTMRAARPRGVVLGAWACVEDLRIDAALRDLPGAPGVYQQQYGGGHIHAPSIDQAAAGAILRNAYIERYGSERDEVAVDLSPPRVRRALWLLDGVRQGLPLGALLGQQFEQGLRSQGGLPMMRFVAPLRAAFPLTPPVTPEAAGVGARERIEPRDVVDGLALHRDPVRARATVDALHPLDGERAAFEAELLRLVEGVDAVADLFTAESAFQTVKGQPAAAGASLAALARGERPPDPEVVRTPRSGRTVTHRVILRFPMPEAGESASWGTLGTVTPRAGASRSLEAWLDHVLGLPENIGCVVGPKGEGDDTAGDGSRWVSVRTLGLRAVDLLALLREDDLTQPSTELQQRIAVAGGLPAGSHAVDLFDLGTRPAPARSLGEVLALLRLLRPVLTRARPLRPADLAAPQTALDPTPAVPDLDVDRQGAALGDLQEALKRVVLAGEGVPTDLPASVAQVEGALRTASLFGIDRAYPAPGAPDIARYRALVAQARSVWAEAGRRVDAVARAAEPSARARAIFGDDFVALPPLVSANPALVAAAGAEAPAGHPHEAWKWLQQSARVRPPVGALSRLLAALRAVGHPWGLTVAQLPQMAGESWAGWRMATPPTREFVSLALLGPPTAAVTAAPTPIRWSAVVVDEWPERIPSAEETTGVAFHYRDPGAEAAQTVLVAAPPAPDQKWSVDLLERVLLDTLELARLRAVTPELLGTLRQYLPAVFLTENVRNEAVSTNLSESTRGEPSVQGAE
jgi:hypothetical protein